jgi:hypothetical protein
MIIFCDYCGARCQINEHELDDWIELDPESGDKRVMCPSCEIADTAQSGDCSDDEDDGLAEIASRY